MKTVGKRKIQSGNVLKDAAILQKTLNHMRATRLVKKGVYRFNKFIEANEWFIKAIANTHVHLKSKM